MVQDYSYNFRYYLPAIGKWLSKDPIGEEGGWNLYAFCRNNAVNTWDELGMQNTGLYPQMFGFSQADAYFRFGQANMQPSTTEEKSSSSFLDDIKYILGNANRAFSYMYGFSISVLSGDLFYKYQEPVFGGNNCEYVFSINGVGNSLSDIYDKNGWINSISSIVLSGPNEDRPSYNHIDNYSSFSGVADIIQAMGDESDLISISSIRAARSINKAGKDAENKCKDCYRIYVIAHSQGTGIFKNALPIIEPKYRKHITFLGFGGQFLANSFWDISEFHNFINKDDAIPMILNFYLPNRSYKGFFSSMHRNTHFEYDDGWGLSHKFNAHYLDYFKTYWENRPRLKNGGK